MFKWLKKFGKQERVSAMLRALLKPVLFTLMMVIDTTLAGWKTVMITKLEIADPSKFIGIFASSVEDLRRCVKSQIKKVVGE